MSFTRVKPAGWAVNEKLTSAQQNALDIDHANSVDKTIAGDTLSGVLTFGATGQLAGTSAGTKLAFTGGASATFGASCHLTASGAGAQIIAGSSGVFVGDTPQTYTLVTPSTRTVSVLPVPAIWTAGWTVSTGSPFPVGPATSTAIVIPLPPLHNGATLSTVIADITVGTVHGSVPAVLPSMQLVRHTLGTNTTTAIGTQAFPTPGSGAAWYAAGASQSWTLTVSTVIDTSQYEYYIVLSDESGANSIAGNLFYGFRLGYTTINDMRFP